MLFLDALHSKRIFFYLGVKTWRKEFCNWFFPLWNKHIYLIILINLITEILFQYRDVSSFLFYFKWKPVRACYFSSFFFTLSQEYSRGFSLRLSLCSWRHKFASPFAWWLAKIEFKSEHIFRYQNCKSTKAVYFENQRFKFSRTLKRMG